MMILLLPMGSNNLKRVTMMSVVMISFALVKLMPVATAFSRAQYADALDKSILFFDLQRSGPLPRWHRLSWREKSGLNDGHGDNVDLTGGYYDAGDNVKFGFPMAFSLTVLSWSVVEFGLMLGASGQLGNTLNAIGWGTDYLLKASARDNQLWVQVGEPYSDHSCWQRPEDMDTPRTSYKVDAKHPGSDVAGETAAALAAASIALRSFDRAYSSELLQRARKVFTFADRYRGKYSEGPISRAVCPFYCSYMYEDELVWAAAWLYKATGDNAYMHYLVANGVSLGGTTAAVNVFSWDNKYAGAQMLLAQFALTGTRELLAYKDRAEDYICNVLPRSISPTSQTLVTAGGLLFHDGNCNMQYVTSTAFLLMVYSKYVASVRGGVVNCGGTLVTSAQMFAFAKQQVDYILGANPRRLSYMIGFGARSPTHVHHRASSIPSIKVQPRKVTCLEGFNYFNSGSSNPNQATGAIVGGPDQYDNINDVRSNFVQMEPTTYNTAPVVGVLAVLAYGATFQ